MRILFLLISILLSLRLIAQPTNDACSGVIDLNMLPLCPSDVYSNIGAPPYDIMADNEPSCFISNPPLNDVWFSFTAIEGIIDYGVTVTETNQDGNQALSSIQVALYRGFCLKIPWH